MRIHSSRLVRTMAVLSFISGSAFATDYYVDAVLGNDANSGTSAQLAWRTLSHATSIANGEPIHAAAGTYDARLGEAFPLRNITAIHIIGAGPASTVLDGGASASAIVSCNHVRLEGVRLANAGDGVFFGTGLFDGTCDLRDVEIDGMSGRGVNGVGTGLPYGNVHVALDHARITNCRQGGVSVFIGNDWQTGSTLFLTGCEISACGGPGVDFTITGVHATGKMTMRSCRIDSNQTGVTIAGSYQATASIEDSLIVRNAGDGFRTGGTNTTGYAWRSTFARNGGAGGTGVLDLYGCILEGNGDDVSGVVNATSCDIGDGDFEGTNGNIAADPLFVDPLAGDFRLRFRSPCIDTGPPRSMGTLDLAGNPRSIDGDLDALALPDIGALEFLPLEVIGVPRTGATILLGLTGQRGATASLYGSRLALVAAPAATPFGDLRLDRNSIVLVAETQTNPWSRSVVTFAVPDHPAWIGMTLSFQALMPSASAPMGSALSNAIELTVAP